MLLDENLPKRLKSDFDKYEIYTVRDCGWQGRKNGELLQLMIENNFNLFLTFDKNIAYQQNFDAFPIPVIIFDTLFNDYQTLKPFVPLIIETIENETLTIGINTIP